MTLLARLREWIAARIFRLRLRHRPPSDEYHL